MSEFRTTDLYEASYLYAVGAEFLRLEGEGQKWFVFSKKEECEELAKSFWGRKGVVNAKEFVDAIRTLKDLLFAR